jgi:hypothetical protein
MNAKLYLLQSGGNAWIDLCVDGDFSFWYRSFSTIDEAAVEADAMGMGRPQIASVIDVKADIHELKRRGFKRRNG